VICVPGMGWPYSFSYSFAPRTSRNVAIPLSEPDAARSKIRPPAPTGVSEGGRIFSGPRSVRWIRTGWLGGEWLQFRGPAQSRIPRIQRVDEEFKKKKEEKKNSFKRYGDG
jgi:hypothetical protein